MNNQIDTTSLMPDLSSHRLVYAPYPSLETAAQPFPPDNLAYRLVVSKNMQDLCLQHRGLGIAANQIDFDAAVFVTHVQSEMITCFNPQIHEISDDTVLMSEGCLSDPGLYLKVKRPDMIKASWEDESGARSQATLFGMDCRVFLHEYDHLQGILFTDRVGSVKLKAARKKQSTRFKSAMNRIIDNG